MRVLRSLLVVSALVLVACGGDVEQAAPAPEEIATVGAGETIEVVGTDSLQFSKTDITAPAGEITFELICEPAVDHDITIEYEDADDETVVVCDAGETATGSITMEPGEYVFYCSIPGHRSAGMEGMLNVVAAS